ncbi:S10 family peptidase [Natronoglycomyces albus]|uniref:Peptidase S10 n=1 Tax=Natronoglycomyces albus TaxID=2811108 RepID=A0A895XPV2_9ACTN|nr:peptidase S10 [Natronoglycomyces albus]QSB05135.1 peptidase S10 [Natronoglycomyces albus]
MSDKKHSASEGTSDPKGNDVEKKDKEPKDDLKTTHHKLGKLKYTATTGRIVLAEEHFEDEKFNGRKPKAEVSITYYTLDDADPKERPVTFAFNGGPGSASIWLHLGVLGPRRVDSGDVGNLTPPPFGLIDNHETLLRDSDLVFIDPMSTGYSRAVEGEKPDPYHGFKGDLESVAEVIRLWTTRNNRWLSPKYLIGESYGGTRAASVGEYLQSRYGMFLNGLMLIAPALDMGTLRFGDNNDLPYSLFLPVYSAIAHYHGLHEGRELEDVVAEARAYAADEFPLVLAKGGRLTPEERATAVAKVASLTGVSEEYVDNANLRLEHAHYYAELLRHRKLVTGRLDSRFTGPADHYVHETMPGDPFLTAIQGPYTAAMMHYLRAELEYENDLVYETLTRNVHPWSYKEFEGQQVTVVDLLGKAMRFNPALQVHVAMGRYDGGVPSEAIEHSLAQLRIPDEARERIEVKEYPAGHMMYVHEESRLRQAADLSAFINATSNR